MTTYAEFYSGTNWQESSGPVLTRLFDESDLWPVADNSGSGTKDALADGLHPAIAIGGRTAADGRPLNMTGVVVSVQGRLVVVNIAHGFAILNYVSNILTYNGGNANSWESAPVIGQPVYVDDSNDLGEGCTLSMSPLNDAGVKNPLWGVLWYSQDEMVDYGVGGANYSASWPKSWSDSVSSEYLVPILHTAGSRELA